MANFVIAGKADCPFYALAEFLGDRLTSNLPDFKLHKIVKTSSEWPDWLKEICEKNGWNHSRSPIIWRELVDRGGKGTLIGGANEFQEYANGYYGVTIEMRSQDAMIVAKENEKTKEIIDCEVKELVSKYNPLYMCITNASNPICFALISYLLSGEILRLQPDLVLTLYDADVSTLSLLDGAAEDIMDMGYATLKEKVRVTSDVEAAFQKCQIVIFLDELPRNFIETKQNWLKRSSNVFSYYGQVLNEVARRDVKVFVAGDGNINLHVSILIENAPNIQKKNFVGVSRFLEYHAKRVLAEFLNVNTACIADVVIWGNLNRDYLVNIQKSRVYENDCSIVGPPSFSLSSLDVIFKEKWVTVQYTALVQSRKKIVEKQLKHPEYNLHARSIALTLNDIWNGSTTNHFFSMAIVSQGWYGVPEGLVFSFPVQISVNGNYNVVEDFELTPEFEEELQPIVKELQTEKGLAAGEIIEDFNEDDAQTDMAVTETTVESIPETITEATESLEKVPREDEEEEMEEEEEEEEVEEETVGSTFEATITSAGEYTETGTNEEMTEENSTDAMTESKSYDVDLVSESATTDS